MTAREEILRRINVALAGATSQPVARAYRVAGELDRDGRVALFRTRVEDYGGVVLESAAPAETIAAVLVESGASRIGVPPDFDEALLPVGVEVVADDRLTPRQLDALDGALTTCAAACAETGTIALDGGPGQGRRALTLVPDLHVCVVRRDDVVETVPELFARLEASARAGRPIVLVSGPSATSDIELTRVEGVHGPRRLVVVLVDRPPA